MLTCHCTVGAGFPVAPAVKVAVVPALTVVLLGCVLTLGALLTVRVAAVVFTIPEEFVNTARYWAPLLTVLVAKLYVSPVALGISDQLPLVFTCHCTVGVGVPVAAAVNVAVSPSKAVRFFGWVLTTGATFTVRVAADENPVHRLFVNFARYWLPLLPATVVNE